MDERERKSLSDVSERVKQRFDQLKIHNPNDGRYQCWDCEKEIFGVTLGEETKLKMPLDAEGFRLLICKECGENEKDSF